MAYLRNPNAKVADGVQTSHKVEMISFRLPWYTLLSGLLVAVLSSILSDGGAIRLPLILLGGLMLLDGGLGLRTLPAMTPFASFPRDWLEIERNLYFRRPGIARFTVGGVFWLGLIIGRAIVGSGDWQIWYIMGTLVLWGILWFFSALKSIRAALANDS